MCDIIDSEKDAERAAEALGLGEKDTKILREIWERFKGEGAKNGEGKTGS